MIVTDKQYYMDGYLKSNLDDAIKAVKEDWDMVFFVDGVEGGGKSAMAQQIGYYCDNTLNLDRVCFTPEEFIIAVKKAGAYQCVIFDEAYDGLSSTDFFNKQQKAVKSLLTQIRQKRLFIIIVAPCFFDINKYVVLWRSRLLIHIYTKDGFTRGFFAFYNSERKKQLYVLGKKFYSYGSPKANFIGRFGKGYLVDEEQYRAKKLKAAEDTPEEEAKAEKEAYKNWLFARLQEPEITINNRQKWEILGMPEATYWRKLKAKREKDTDMAANSNLPSL